MIKKIFAKTISILMCIHLIGQPLIHASAVLSNFYSTPGTNLIKSKKYYLNDKNFICAIESENSIDVQYFYDKQGQLIRENNFLTNESTVYEYDIKDNLINKVVYSCLKENVSNTSPKKNTKYTYDDDNRILSYDGKPMEYDEFGNISKYLDYLSIKWKNGKISEITSPNGNIKYNYDDKGNRISKSVNGIVTKFNFTKKEAFQTVDDKVFRWYLSNEKSNKHFSFDGKDYSYICNAQGDIIAIADDKDRLVANYTYDTWGQLLSIHDENGKDITNDLNHIGNINPLRYRGYYYDSETGFYYLNSRYYDPKIGRFLTADNKNYLVNNNIEIPNNLYIYCMNNPVNMVDHDGHSPVTLAVLSLNPATAGAAAAVAAATTALTLTNPMIKKIVDDAIAWAVRTCTVSAAKILAQFKQLNQNICNRIAELVNKYIMYSKKQSIPNGIKTPDGKIDISKFTTPCGKGLGGGPRRRPPKGPTRWHIEPYQIGLSMAHRGDFWKLYFNEKMFASLKADGTITKIY